MIEVSEWARDILNRSQAAARRFNPDAKIRLVRGAAGVEPQLAPESAPDDQPVEVGDMTLFVEQGLEGLVDIEEPHDRLVLRPLGSTPNVRSEH